MPTKTQPNKLSDAKRERLLVAATVTQEDAWNTSEPNQGFARGFVIMLLVHVVIIGGIILYDFFSVPAEPAQSSSKATAKAVTEQSSASKVTTAAPITVAPLPTTAAPMAPEPVVAPAAPVPAPSPEPLVANLAPAPAENRTTTIVDLPPAPLPNALTASKAAERSSPPAPAMIDKPESATPRVTRDEAPKVTKTESSPPRAIAITSTTPKPVMTPSAAKRDLNSSTNSTSTKAKTKSSPPAPVAAKKSTPAPTTSRHTIKKGDTVYGIARKYKVSEAAILKANGLKNANLIQPGRTLVIPK